MRKLFTNILILSLTFTAFAAEFVFSTTMGYDNAVLYDISYPVKVKTDAFGITLNIGTITKSGFTFYWDNTIAINETMSSDSTKIRTNGIFYHTEFLFGRTKKFLNDTLHLGFNCGLGIGFGRASIRAFKNGTEPWVTIESVDKSQKEIHTKLLFGPSFHANVDYYFTNNVGITISLTDTLSFGVSESASYNNGVRTSDPHVYQQGFGNLFSLKLGPKFKF